MFNCICSKKFPDREYCCITTDGEGYCCNAFDYYIQNGMTIFVMILSGAMLMSIICYCCLRETNRTGCSDRGVSNVTHVIRSSPTTGSNYQSQLILQPSHLPNQVLQTPPPSYSTEFFGNPPPYNSIFFPKNEETESRPV